MSATEPAAPRARRMRADERRELLLDAARAEFATAGLAGATTDAIARRAGISQSYVFRLFPSKLDLFLATVGRCFDSVAASFAAAVEGTEPGPARLQAMGESYKRVLRDRDELLLQLQAYAACGDPRVQAFVRERYRRLFELVRDQAGVSREQLLGFFSTGMLLNVAAALQIPELFADEEWALRCLGAAAVVRLAAQ